MSETLCAACGTQIHPSLVTCGDWVDGYGFADCEAIIGFHRPDGENK